MVYIYRKTVIDLGTLSGNGGLRIGDGTCGLGVQGKAAVLSGRQTLCLG
jgi:hypothetical protein